MNNMSFFTAYRQKLPSEIVKFYTKYSATSMD
jgi:hypothetical protein